MSAYCRWFTGDWYIYRAYNILNNKTGRTINNECLVLIHINDKDHKATKLFTYSEAKKFMQHPNWKMIRYSTGNEDLLQNKIDLWLKEVEEEFSKKCFTNEAKTV